MTPEDKVLVLRHARIYTGVDAQPWTTALAVVNGRITATGEAALAWAALPGAIVEELAGALVVPGFTDAHMHFAWYAQALQELDLRDLSRADFLRCVAERAAVTPPGKWLLGRGWDQNLWADDRFPTAAELDAVAPLHPVALVAKSAHALVANSAALRAAGITAATADPPHGRLGRTPDGMPDGMAFEAAMELVQAAIPAPSLPQLVAAMESAQPHLLAAGITGIHDMDAEPALAAFQTLRAAQRLQVRVVKYIPVAWLDEALALGLRSGLGDAWLRLGGLKLFTDGGLGTRTGAMLAPYEEEPENYGLLALEPEALQAVVRRATAGGLALAIHAIGDRANRLALDALETAQRALGGMPLRHRIEHVQTLHPDDLPRLAQLGVIASMQPIHATHDWRMAERYLGRRTAYSYAWRSLLTAGTVLAFGSDAPVEPFTPLLGLYAAVTRRHEDGSPGPEGWHPEQCLTLPEALRAYTWGPAYVAGLEQELGRLAPGYWADLVVLDRDLFAVSPEAWLEGRVLRTMVGGVWRYPER